MNQGDPEFRFASTSSIIVIASWEGSVMRFSHPAFMSILLSAVLAGLAAAPTGEAVAGTPRERPHTLNASVDQQQIRLTPIGIPTWKPVDLHIFSAPLGTAASDFEFLDDTLIALLPPPNHAFDENVGIVPGDPHAPPYGHELGDGVTSNGFHENGPFSVPEFTSPNAIWLAMMNIPEDPPAALGSSPDFNSGPIIPNDIFPILASGSTTHDGELFSEPFSDVSIPGPNDLGFDVEGHSHFPQFMIENTEFRTEPDPEPAGGYTLHLEMIDQDGDGWQIDASFVVGCTIIGTPGNDALSGTSGNDIICGLGGNDSIVGGNGNDIIRGGTGNDNISGGAGNDTISGGNGSDNIRSGSDNDTAEGGNGEDTLNSVDGVSGNDRNSGGPGNDTCTDDPGDVTIC